MKIWKKLVCGAVAATMVLAAGCSSEDMSWSYRTQESALPVGAYIYYMIETASVAQEKLLEEHAEQTDYTPPDSYKKLLKETVEEKPIPQYILEGAEKRCKEYFAVEKQFADKGLALGDVEKAYAQTTAANTIEQNPLLYEKNGVAESSLRQILENDAKRQLLFNSLYEEGGEQAVPEQELKDFYASNYAMADIMVFYQAPPAEGQEAIADEQNIGKQTAEEFLQKIKDGADFYETIYETRKADAERAGQDPESVQKPAEGSMTGILSDSTRATYGNALTDGVFAAPVGEPVLIEDQNYYYVAKRKDIMEDEDGYHSARSTLLADLKGDEFVAQIDAWAEGTAPEANAPVLEKYRPEKLKID